MARPVESKSVTAPACGRPGASPARTAPRSVTTSRVTTPCSTARRQLAAVAGLRPLVAEQRARDDRRDRRLRLARAVGAEHVEVQARPQVADVDDGLGARRHAADDVAGQRGLAVAGLPAELVGQRLRHLAPAGRRTRPARSRRRPGSAPPTRRAGRSRRSRPSSRPHARARARRPPPRRRCAARSPSARRAARPGALVAASLRTTTPMTVGRPCSGLPGNDEIHLSIARPSPRAGIARKSPCPGLSR